MIIPPLQIAHCTWPIPSLERYMKFELKQFLTTWEHSNTIMHSLPVKSSNAVWYFPWNASKWELTTGDANFYPEAPKLDFTSK